MKLCILLQSSRIHDLLFHFHFSIYCYGQLLWGYCASVSTILFYVGMLCFSKHVFVLIDLSTVFDSILTRGQAMRFWPTLKYCNAATKSRSPTAKCLLKDICFVLRLFAGSIKKGFRLQRP